MTSSLSRRPGRLRQAAAVVAVVALPFAVSACAQDEPIENGGVVGEEGGEEGEEGE